MDIKALRESLSLTQEELAKELGLKSKSYICGMEVGDKQPSRRIAIAIYRKYGVKLGPIADLTDDVIAVLERFPVRKAA